MMIEKCSSTILGLEPVRSPNPNVKLEFVLVFFFFNSIVLVVITGRRWRSSSMTWTEILIRD